MTININHPDHPEYKARKQYPLTDYVPEALRILAPNAAWRVTGDFTYEEIQWESSDIPIPSKEEVMNKAQELKDAYDQKEYARLRAVNYPSIEEQLDKLYHEGYEGWKSSIDQIKEQFPKPL